MAYVTIDGYIVRRTTEKALGIVKEGAGPQADPIWVPRACCESGDDLDVDDTDIIVFQNIAESKGLDF